MTGTVTNEVRRCTAAIRHLLKSGAIPLGERMPPPAEMAARMGVSPETVRTAYARLLERDELSGVGYPAIEANLFAGSWKELSSPSFEMPRELARACGLWFSYRAEAPGVPLHLKVEEDDVDADRGRVQHGHDFYELVLVRHGAGIHLHGRDEYPIYSGDCFIVGPGQTHGYTSRQRLGLTNVIFYEESLAPYAKLLADVPGFTAFFAIEPLFRRETSFRHKLHLRVPDMLAALELCRQIDTELHGKRPGCYLAALAYFFQLVVAISRWYDKAASSAQTLNELAGKSRVVAEAIAFLEANAGGGISVPELAKSLFLSQSRLQHVFKESTGMSLMEYLLQIRIDHACMLLRSTDLPILRIAGEVGFHDRAYFARQFRKKIGCTPRQYRRSQIGKTETV